MLAAPTDRPDGCPGGVALVLLAAGAGTRSGHDTNKVYLPLAGRRVLTWSLDTTRGLTDLVTTIVVVQDHERGHADTALRREAGGRRQVRLVPGGKTRHGSEFQALRALAPQIYSREVGIVVIHDAARPLASLAMFEDVVRTARRYGGALPVLDQDGLIFEDGAAVRERLVRVQTPQAFHALPLLAAYERAAEGGFVGSDTAACVERYGNLPVRSVTGDPRNLKITFPEDLFIAERLLAKAHWTLTSSSRQGDAGER